MWMKGDNSCFTNFEGVMCLVHCNIVVSLKKAHCGGFVYKYCLLVTLFFNVASLKTSVFMAQIKSTSYCCLKTHKGRVSKGSQTNQGKLTLVW